MSARAQRRQQKQQKSKQPTRSQSERLPDAHRTARGAQSADGAVQMFEAYQGLLPHPEHLAQFNEISPGAADKIIDEFVRQGAHRRELEAQVVTGNESRGGRGQVLGFLLLLAVIICGTVIALTTNATVGGSVIGGAVTGGAVIYVVGGRPPKAQ